MNQWFASAAMLAGLAIAESWVYLRRYRSAVGACKVRSANDAAMVVLLRLAVMWVGVGAVMDDMPLVVAVVAYAGTTWVATRVMHPPR